MVHRFVKLDVQAIITSILGLTREGESLQINPCVPAEWKSFEINYRYKKTNYHITVQLTDDKNKSGVVIDGNAQSENRIHLVDDEVEHVVMVKAKRA